MSSRAGVRFVDRVVGRECWVGDDEGIVDHGLPPCRFGWSAAPRDCCCSFANVALVGARGVAMVWHCMSPCVLSMQMLDVQWTMDLEAVRAYVLY